VLCKIRYDGLSQCFAIPVVSEVAASADELSERCSALSWQAGRQAGRQAGIFCILRHEPQTRLQCVVLPDGVV
jgi:hypothetical protein